MPNNIYIGHCCDKDCLEDVRVYLTQSGQEVVDRAISIKVTRAEIIWVFTDIENVPFNRGFYSIDLKYFFKIVLHVYTGVGRPIEVEGLATFNKRVILFGSEGNAKIFSSKYKQNAFDPQQWKKTKITKAIFFILSTRQSSVKNGITKPFIPLYGTLRHDGQNRKNHRKRVKNV